MRKLTGQPNVMLRYLLAIALIAVGVYYIASTQQVEASDSRIINAAPVAQKKTLPSIKKTVTTPNSLSIPAINLNLPVKNGYYIPSINAWNIDDTSVFLAVESVTPLYYGHNRSSAFGDLYKIGENDKLVITDDDSVLHSYVYYATRFIEPDDASILAEDNPGMVMLMTCYGTHNEKRRIVYFKEQYDR